MTEPHAYELRIDGPDLKRQRELLLRLAEHAHNKTHYIPREGDAELLEGLIALTDEIADQAHDEYGIDCTFDTSDGLCECERPGQFHCGVRGVLAHLENGRLAPGAKVERCDLCCRFPSDAAARQRLVELGIV